VLGARTLERYARAALDGVGDAEAGEWTEAWQRGPRPGNKAFHVRRRLTPEEAAQVGDVVDVRGTPEVDRRLAVVRRWLPKDWTE
jgi:hypothetical protein